MSLNFKKAIANLQKDLSKNWEKLSFSYEQVNKDEFQAKSEVALNNFDDDILIIMHIHSGGTAQFRVVFDKIEKNEKSLDLLNEFNYSNPFFKAFIRDDGFLELSHFIAYYSDDVFKDYGNEFVLRVIDLQDNTAMQELAKLTKFE